MKIAMKFMVPSARSSRWDAITWACSKRNKRRKWGSLRNIDDPVTIGLYYFILFYTYHPNLSEKTEKKYPIDFFQ